MKKIFLIIVIAFFIFRMAVLATDIDIGPQAIDRPTYSVGGRTIICLANPANASGTITSVEIWAWSNFTSCEVATFYLVSAGHYSTRDYEYIGNVTSGSKQTFEVNLNVEEGDYIGMYNDAGYPECSNAGEGSGVWYNNGDTIPCSNISFTQAWPDRDLSLHGTGITTEEEENAIFFGINL